MASNEEIVELWESGQFQDQKELATHLGKSVQRISQALVKKQRGVHDLDEYLKFLKKQAYNPKSPVKNRELYAKILGWLAEKKDENKEEISAEEYISIGTRVAKQLQDTYRQGNGNCPVCGRPQEMGNQPRMDTEPKQPED